MEVVPEFKTGASEQEPSAARDSNFRPRNEEWRMEKRKEPDRNIKPFGIGSHSEAIVITGGPAKLPAYPRAALSAERLLRWELLGEQRPAAPPGNDEGNEEDDQTDIADSKDHWMLADPSLLQCVTPQSFAIAGSEARANGIALCIARFAGPRLACGICHRRRWRKLTGWPQGRGAVTIAIAHVTFAVAYATVVIQARIVATAGNHLVEAKLRFQACDKEVCMPPKTIPVAIDVIAQ